MAMCDIRCSQCNRKLAAASGFERIEIKCPRCGHLQRATSSESASKETDRGYPNHSLDGRQAPLG
ncbi:Com family DNA-binding transcriptional regulator [Bisbaumannia pacifica]|uniref:Com family DNA-binding transcriptional regulator n=1 Tax=Bisbaumannia pacifica TaxID=77098 RepID=UPI003BEEC142